MSWLLLEMLAFIVAAAGFGVLIGLGLSAAGANRKVVGQQRAHQGLLDQIQALEQSQRVVEVKAEARSAAEAAVRGDLEGRLVEVEAAGAEYRARAESAERQLRLLQTPDYVTPVGVEPAAHRAAERAEFEKLKAAFAESEAERSRLEEAFGAAAAERDTAQAVLAATQRDAEAARAIAGQEITSLSAQLAAAEKVRAKSEADLALAHARAEAVMRSAAALMGGPLAPAMPVEVPQPVAPPASAPPASGMPAAPIWDPPLPTSAANGNLPAAGGEASETNGNGNGSLPQAPLLDEHDRPPGLKAPRGGRADDLRRIRGIGPRNEGVLNALGLYHYEQIASLSDRNVTWLDSYFRFPGRIGREDWVGQAKTLVAQRGRTDVSDKVHPDDAGF